MKKYDNQPRAIFTFDYQICLHFDRVSIIPGFVGVYSLYPVPTNTIKMGFFGGAGEPDLSGKENLGVTPESIEFSREWGGIVGRYNKKIKPDETRILPVTGAPPGNPAEMAFAAAELGTLCVGLSPFYDEEHHLEEGSPTKGYHFICYIGQDRHAGFNSPKSIRRQNVQFGLRNGYNILGSHNGTFAGGTNGTLDELAKVIQFGRNAVLAKVGGCSDKFMAFYSQIYKDTGSRFTETKDPYYAFRRLLELEVQNEKNNGKRQKLFTDDLITRVNQEIKRHKHRNGVNE